MTAPAALGGVKAGGNEDRSYDERHLLVVQDSQSYASLLQTVASLSASGLTWSASASMSFLRDQTGSETSTSFVGLHVHRSQLRIADMSKLTVGTRRRLLWRDLSLLTAARSRRRHARAARRGQSFAARGRRRAAADALLYALMHWRDPYGPPNELDMSGNQALLTGSNPATWVSNALWPSYPWNQFSARLIGIDPAM